MSSFTVPIEVAASSAGPFVAIDAVAGTGAFYSWVPRSILERLGVAPAEVQAFGLAGGSVVHRAIAEVVVRLDGRSRHTVCGFGDEGTEPLLGAVTPGATVTKTQPRHRILSVIPLPWLHWASFAVLCVLGGYITFDGVRVLS